MIIYDFSTALTKMKDGKAMHRLGWDKTPLTRRKRKVTIDGDKVFTYYLNYYSDRGVFSMDDIMANDWVEDKSDG